jgi:phosphate starvation-inducible PhoH-like protein
MSKKHRSGKRVDEANASETVGKDKSPRVIQRGKIEQPLNIRYPYEITEKQQQLLDIILDKDSKIIFVSGPAGTAKTLFAAYAGLTLLNEKRVSDIVFVRSLVESASKQAGALPGLLSEKFLPYTVPLGDKLSELLPASDVNYLTKDNRIEYLPINFARGTSMNVKYIMADEVQNMSTGEILTLVTRLGRFSKMVLCGDPGQSDIGRMSGFMKFFDLFNDSSSREQGIHCFSFTRDDIVRNGILRHIMEKVETAPWNTAKANPDDWRPGG